MSTRAFTFELSNNHVYFQARVNQRAEPCWFILDTCAGSTLLNERLARELGLEPVPGSNFVAFGAGQGGDAPAGTFVRGVSLRLAGVEVAFPSVGAIPLGGLELHEGRRVDGIVGYELFSRFVTEFDYAGRTIRLAEPNGYSYDGPVEAVPFEMMAGRLPLVQAAILRSGHAPAEGGFLIDTGASLALAVANAFDERHGLVRSAARVLPAKIGLGISGQSNGVLARVGGLRLGGVEVENFVGSFSRDTEGVFKLPGLAGLVGGEILRRFKAVFDYKRRRMYLEPNASLNDPFDHDMSGLSLMSAGADFGGLRVHGVVRQSPAGESGLQEGDVFVALDGQPASHFTLEQVRRMFKQGGRAYNLTFTRPGQPGQLEARLRLRKLI